LGKADVRTWADEPGRLQFLDAGQIAPIAQAEMREEPLARNPSDRPTRRLAPSLGHDPTSLHEDIERAAAHDDAADLLDLATGNGLVIGDDGERLDRCARELPRYRLFELELGPKIRRGAERPAAGDAHDIDAAGL